MVRGQWAGFGQDAGVTPLQWGIVGETSVNGSNQLTTLQLT